MSGSWWQTLVSVNPFGKQALIYVGCMQLLYFNWCCVEFPIAKMTIELVKSYLTNSLCISSTITKYLSANCVKLSARVLALSTSMQASFVEVLLLDSAHPT